VEAKGRVICDHISQFYSGTAGEPVLYWRFEADAMPSDSRFLHSQSTQSDECHVELVGVSDKSLKNRFRAEPWSNFMICSKDGARHLQQADLESF
jgi:hypothetical protein